MPAGCDHVVDTGWKPWGIRVFCPARVDIKMLKEDIALGIVVISNELTCK
jgi:hypothetical protein